MTKRWLLLLMTACFLIGCMQPKAPVAEASAPRTTVLMSISPTEPPRLLASDTPLPYPFDGDWAEADEPIEPAPAAWSAADWVEAFAGADRTDGISVYVMETGTDAAPVARQIAVCQAIPLVKGSSGLFAE